MDSVWSNGMMLSPDVRSLRLSGTGLIKQNCLAVMDPIRAPGPLEDLGHGAGRFQNSVS